MDGGGLGATPAPPIEEGDRGGLGGGNAGAADFGDAHATRRGGRGKARIAAAPPGRRVALANKCKWTPPKYMQINAGGHRSQRCQCARVGAGSGGEGGERVDGLGRRRERRRQRAGATRGNPGSALLYPLDEPGEACNRRAAGASRACHSGCESAIECSASATWRSSLSRRG